MIDFREVYDKTLQNGGHTVEETGRYMVGLEGYELVVPLDEFNEEILQYYFMNILPDRPNVTMGTWIHEGKVYIDTSKGFDSELQALTIAEQNNQIAIYEAESGFEIKVD